MPPRRLARAYILAVIVLGAAAVVRSASVWSCDPLQFACYLTLALFTSTLKVRLPGIEGTFSANSVFPLVAVAQLGFAEAVALSVCCALVQSLWRTAKPPQAIQVVFNAAVWAMSIAATFYVYQFLLRSTAPGPNVMAFVAASCVFFIVNTFAISIVIGLVERTSFFGIWRIWHLWSFPYYLVSVALAAVLMSSGSAVAWKLAIATLPLILAVFLCYRRLVRRFSEAQT
jgi:hypothetical protein